MAGKQGSSLAAIVRSRRGHLGALAGLLAVAVTTSATAQTATGQTANLPSRDELRAGAPPAAPAAIPHTRLKVEDRIERAPCALDNPAYANIRVTLADASFDGLGPVPAAALDDAWRQYVGTEQPVSVVCRIRDAAATTLRGLGYIAAVEVPVQRIEAGHVRFAVLYAKVTQVRVIGRPGRNAGLLEAYVAHLADGQVFNRFQAERNVLLAQDIPGYDLHLVLKPAGTGAGAMIAEVKVDEIPFQADAAITNLASPSTGRFGGQLRVAFNGLTGLGDQTTLSAYSTADFREQQIYQLGHRFQLGHSGLQLAGHFTYAITKPDLGPTVPPVRATTRYANVELKYPLLKRQALAVQGTLGLDVVDQDVRFAGLPLSRDRVRIGYARLDLDALDLAGRGPGGSVLWRIGANAELRHGLSILGASPNCLQQPAACAGAGFVPPGIANGNPEATVFRAGADFEVRPLAWLSLQFSPRFQLASAPLFAFEQFQLGNYTLGRGFDPGTVAGDDGAGFSLELRGPVFRPAHNLAFTVQPYVFSDNGWAWLRLPVGPNNPLGLNPLALHSLGAGARFDIADRGHLDLMVAAPVNTIAGEATRRDPLFLMTFSANLTPRRTK